MGGLFLDHVRSQRQRLDRRAAGARRIGGQQICRAPPQPAGRSPSAASTPPAAACSGRRIPSGSGICNTLMEVQPACQRTDRNARRSIGEEPRLPDYKHMRLRSMDSFRLLRFVESVKTSSLLWETIRTAHEERQCLHSQRVHRAISFSTFLWLCCWSSMVDLRRLTAGPAASPSTAGRGRHPLLRGLSGCAARMANGRRPSYANDEP